MVPFCGVAFIVAVDPSQIEPPPETTGGFMVIGFVAKNFNILQKTESLVLAG